MVITKEHLIAQRQDLLRKKEGHVANANAIAGAITQLDMLLAQLEAPEVDQTDDSKKGQ